MHQAARLEFERVVEEYVRWRIVPGDQRSPAPSWWWGPAMAVIDDHAPMGEMRLAELALRIGPRFSDAARMILALFVEQTSLTGPQDFPSLGDVGDHDVRELHPQPSDDSAFQP